MDQKLARSAFTTIQYCVRPTVHASAEISLRDKLADTVRPADIHA
jgi:hypothetical protein